MALIQPSEIKFYESAVGPHLGGAITETEITPSALWDTVSGAESQAGDVEYRALYVKNTSANTTGLVSAVVWISAQTPAGDDISIALAGEGKNGTMETIADESTAPAVDSFSAPANKAAGLSLGTLAQDDYYGMWHKRNVPASTGGYTGNSYTITVEGDTQP